MKFWKRVRFTKVSLIQFGIGLVLNILAILFAVNGVKSWFYNTHFTSAMYSYHSNQLEKAIPSVESAISWGPKYLHPVEMLAKIKTDLGKLDEAEELYKGLLNRKGERETVSIGLAILYLKRADSETDPKKVFENIGKAEGYFKRAREFNKDAPELWIGEETKKLISAIKSNRKDPDLFGKIPVEKLKRATWDGLYDYYCGVARALAMKEKTGEDLLRAVRRAFLFSGGSEEALVNRLNMDARWFMSESISFRELQERKTEFDRFYNDVANVRTSYPHMKYLEEPMMRYLSTAGWAYSRQGDLANGTTFFDRTDSPVFGKKYLLAYLMKGLSYQAASENSNIGLDRRLEYKRKARTVFEELLSENLLSDSREDVRSKAILNNNLAVFYEYDSIRFKQPQYRFNAVDRLKTALATLPDDYVLNRNMAILLKKQNKLEEAGPFREKTRQAAQKEKPDSPIAKDLIEFEKYFGAQ